MNDRVKIKENKLLSDNWYRLNKYTFDYQTSNGEWQTQHREVYDRGNGATVLLFNPANSSVILTRQFRLPTYLNNNPDGMLLEACAGLLDGDSPEDCVKKEAEEETGYRIQKVTKIFEAYMSPGAVTETLHFFTAQYSSEQKISDGGGLATEQEDIEVIEMPFEEAYSFIASGKIKDGKTIMLLQYAKLHGLFPDTQA